MAARGRVEVEHDSREQLELAVILAGVGGLRIIGQVPVTVQVQVQAVGGLIPGKRYEFVGDHTATKGATDGAVPSKVRLFEEGLDLRRKAQRVGLQRSG